MNINENIKALLKSKNKQQKQLAERIGVSTSTLNNWLKLNRSIPAEYLIPICEFLDVSPYSLLGDVERDNIILNDDHKSLIKLYDKLDERGKGKVFGVAETLAELAAERAAQEAEKVSKEKKKVVETKTVTVATAANETLEQDEKFYIDLCNLPVSTGMGVYLDEGFTEPLQIKRTVIAERANYAVRVSGNSMEPRFYDGDIVLVKTCPTIEIGEIGIFIVNGEGFIKKRGDDRLISLNPKCDDITIHSYDTVYCRGRVLGKAEIVE